MAIVSCSEEREPRPKDEITESPEELFALGERSWKRENYLLATAAFGAAARLTDDEELRYRASLARLDSAVRWGRPEELSRAFERLEPRASRVVDSHFLMALASRAGSVEAMRSISSRLIEKYPDVADRASGLAETLERSFWLESWDQPMGHYVKTSHESSPEYREGLVQPGPESYWQ